MPEELREVMRTAETLQSLNEAQWLAVRGWAGKALAEALEESTGLETAEDKRAWWCGSAGALRDLTSQLDSLRSGEWRKWPVAVAWQQRGGALEDEADPLEVPD
jgi:hypothetical protein